jgi:hypothetical protein
LKNFLRSLVSIVAGMLVAGACVAGVEALGHRIYPVPAGIDVKDPAVLRDLVAQLPTGTVVSVLVAWIVGSLAGAWVAARLARQLPVGHAAVIGALVLAGAAANMLLIPHPAWMWAGALVGIPLAAYLGGRWAGRRQPTQ